HRLTYLEGAVSGAEQQAINAIRQKDEAGKQINELKGAVEALTTKSTLPWVMDPQEFASYRTSKPNEIQNLSQALALAQTNHAAVSDDNEALRQTIEQKDNELAHLKEKLEAAETKAARNAGALEVASSRLETFMSTVAALAQQFGSNEESAEFERVVDEARV